MYNLDHWKKLYVVQPLFFFFPFFLPSNLSQAHFHRTLKAKSKTQKSSDITLIGREEVAPNLMPDQDQKLPYLGLKGYDMAYCFSDSLLLISEQHPQLLNRWYWHFMAESCQQPTTNLLPFSKSILLHIPPCRNTSNQLNIRMMS